MNTTRSFFTLLTAATAVVALAAGLLLAISAPAPVTEDFSQAVAVTAAADES